MAHKKSPVQLQREIDEALASQSGLSKHYRYLLSQRKPGGGLRAGYLTPVGWHGDPLAIEDPKLRLEALREQSAPRLPKERHHSSIATSNLNVHTLSPEQLKALRTFANANGAQWKFKLNVAWSTGRYDDYPGTDEYGYLQQIRNTFGPEWLTRFSFNKIKTHSVRW